MVVGSGCLGRPRGLYRSAGRSSITGKLAQWCESSSRHSTVGRCKRSNGRGASGKASRTGCVGAMPSPSANAWASCRVSRASMFSATLGPSHRVRPSPNASVRHRQRSRRHAPRRRPSRGPWRRVPSKVSPSSGEAGGSTGRGGQYVDVGRRRGPEGSGVVPNGEAPVGRGHPVRDAP